MSPTGSLDAPYRIPSQRRLRDRNWPRRRCHLCVTATTQNRHGRCRGGSAVYSVVEPLLELAPLRSPGLLWRGHRGRCYRRLGRLPVIAAWCRRVRRDRAPRVGAAAYGEPVPVTEVPAGVLAVGDVGR